MAATNATQATSLLAQLTAQSREQPLVYDGVRPDLCEALEQIVLGRMQRDRGRRVGSINVGGWKSGEDLFQWPEPAIQELGQTICTMIGVRSLVGWSIVNRAGSHHPRHQHRVAILTGIYYVTAGSPEALTPTVFECAGGELDVEPHPGRLAIFPGAMWHKVPVYPGDQPRITIAFDVRR